MKTNILQKLSSLFRSNPEYSVCKECKVYFVPAVGYEARWGGLCPIHRKPIMERDIKRDAVISWASSNWERLVDMMEKDKEEARKFNISGPSQYELSAMQAQAQHGYEMSRQGLGGILWPGIANPFKKGGGAI